MISVVTIVLFHGFSQVVSVSFDHLVYVSYQQRDSNKHGLRLSTAIDQPGTRTCCNLESAWLQDRTQPPGVGYNV